ncbi:MAG: glycerol-3-phosphate transporter, partial [Burkholderiales bacterium]|nr:glycerol-3-phosphate transporter [Burkholderiales bacterium]
MVENRPVRDVFAHAVLIVGIVIVAFPLWVTFVASTLTFDQIVTVPMPLWPGDQLMHNYTQVLTSGSEKGSSAPVSTMLV